VWSDALCLTVCMCTCSYIYVSPPAMLEDFYCLQELLRVRFSFLILLRGAGTPLPQKPATTEMCSFLPESWSPFAFPGEDVLCPGGSATSRRCSLPASSHSLSLPSSKGLPRPGLARDQGELLYCTANGFLIILAVPHQRSAVNKQASVYQRLADSRQVPVSVHSRCVPGKAGQYQKA